MRLQASDELWGEAAVTGSALWSDLSVPITQPTMCPWAPMCSSIYLRVTNGSAWPRRGQPGAVMVSTAVPWDTAPFITLTTARLPQQLGSKG